MRCMLQALVVGVSLMASTASASELPDDFTIVTIPNRSDDRLNGSRIVCAAGELQAADHYAAQTYGIAPRDRAAFCAAIVAEAVKRGQQGALYVRMQPDDAIGELGRIFEAAADNQPEYVNVMGIRKALPCPLAYDAARVYESFRPGDLDMPELSPEQREDLRQDCFNGGAATVNGLIVGVLDQRY